MKRLLTLKERKENMEKMLRYSITGNFSEADAKTLRDRIQQKFNGKCAITGWKREGEAYLNFKVYIAPSSIEEEEKIDSFFEKEYPSIKKKEWWGILLTEHIDS